MTKCTKPSARTGSTDTRSQPRQLADGKGFHDELQEDFIRTSEGRVTRERPIRSTSGKTGRIDIHVAVDEELDSVVEFKRSDWDRMAPHRVGPNIRRYVRQVWRYIEAVMEEGKDVSPGIVFAHMPKDAGLKRRIEEAFEEECITIVWADEEGRTGDDAC
jgi:hypothetical protein